MCGRFTISDLTGIEERFGIPQPNLEPRYNKQKDAPVILNDDGDILLLVVDRKLKVPLFTSESSFVLMLPVMFQETLSRSL